MDYVMCRQSTVGGALAMFSLTLPLVFSTERLTMELFKSRVPLIVIVALYKKLSYCKEAARCLVLLSIFVSR